MSSVLPLKARLVNSVQIPLNEGKILADFMSFEGLEDGLEHLAIGLGDWKTQNEPWVRVHSECLTGDVFASAKCDCGAQLNESIGLFSQQGGILIYLRQEGRGIGLYNKLAAYALQQTGQDTYQANRSLKFPNDLRSYQVAAQILFALGLKTIKLRTNNPDKVLQLKNAGIVVVEQKATGLFVNEHNAHYLRAKALQTNHTLKSEHIENFLQGRVRAKKT